MNNKVRAFWTGFIDGLMLCAVVMGAILLGFLLWAVIAMIFGGSFAVAAIASGLIASLLMGVLYAGTTYDDFDEEEEK